MTTAAELNTAAALAIGRNLRWTSLGGATLETEHSTGRTAPPSAASSGFSLEGSLVAYVACDLHGAAGRPAAVVTYTGTPSTGDVIGIAIDGTDFDFTVGATETALAALTGLAGDINGGSLDVTASVEDGVLYVRSDDGRQHVYAAHSSADIDPDLTVEPSYATPLVWVLPTNSTVWRLHSCAMRQIDGTISANTLLRLDVAGMDRIAVSVAGCDGAWTSRVALCDAAST